MSKIVQCKELKQTVKLTTNMQQSLSMLQMSSLELSELVTRELAANPFLEDASIVEEQESVIKPVTTQDLRYLGHNLNNEYDYLTNLTADVTLKDYLTNQINVEISAPVEKLIACFLVDSLNSNGYVDLDLSEAANILKCQEHLIEQVLIKLQTFDPAGIFARNLKECLKIQLADTNWDHNKFIPLIDNLELIANGEFKKLMKICRVDSNELTTLIKRLKTLNPKPANGFLVETTAFKIPDVILTISKDGEPSLELNYDALPKLRFNNEFYLQIKANIKTKDDKLFTKQELNSAINVTRGIKHRAKTILQVASCIVAAQIDFFTRGVMHLKPLTLGKIAATTGLNESTISRSTVNKYIAAPNGIYELKYFFSSSLNNTRTTLADISSTKVKEIIRQLVLSEEPNNILSDDDIAHELQKFNIKIARRTIVKYRQAVGIPTSAYRKRHKYTLRA